MKAGVHGVWAVLNRCLLDFLYSGDGGHPQNYTPLPQRCIGREGGQYCVHQKWPDKMFPMANFVFSHYGQFGLEQPG